jgi:hypothetical protein
MPVIVTKDNVDYYLVPAPLVSFNKQVYNNAGRPGFGVDYTVSLQGTLIQTHGNPYFSGGSAGIYSSGVNWTRTMDVETEEITDVEGVDRLNATIRKQELIRNLFSNPIISGVAKPIRITIRGWDAGINAGSGITFNGFVDDISFDSEGRWANPGGYTINLRNTNFLGSANGIFTGNENLNQASGYYVSNVTETFDVQEDGRTTLVFQTAGSGRRLQNINKVYNINRSITVVGSPVYDSNGSYINNLAPWQQASGFIHSYLNIGSGTLSGFTSLRTRAIGNTVSGVYRPANFVYQESIDREAGSYSLTETYTLYSGGFPVLETIIINQDTGEDDSNAVNIQGTIQGLNTVDGFATSGNAYFNALSYFTGVVDTGIPSTSYYYARGILRDFNNPSIIPWLHPRPLTKSVATDFNAGTISYTYNYDDRPANLVPGSISESIQISDTYPGELFSVTPVIGRSQPVLQYLNSRSEYKRSLSINLTMGTTGVLSFGTVNNKGENIDSSATRRLMLQRMLLTEKPSISQVSGLNDIFQAANPVNDPSFTVANGKCFHSAPTENWDARARTYSYSIEWTFERTN